MECFTGELICIEQHLKTFAYIGILSLREYIIFSINKNSETIYGHLRRPSNILKLEGPKIQR